MSVIGLRVGPFEIVEEASVPEDGAWYLARRTGMTRKQPSEVLVCLLPPDAPADARAALQRRFEALRAVEGARVPEPVGYFEGVGALVVGAPHGSPLEALVEGRQAGTLAMTPATLLDLVLEVAETLQHAHHKGKLHGHLEPRHVWLGPDGRVTLWGFSEGSHHPVDPAWAAPERQRGEPASEVTDQWSLAALAAALVTGHPPHGPSSEGVDLVERQWPALGRTLRRMLDPRPMNRFPSMHPVRQDLLALARKAGGASERRELGALLAALAPAPAFLIDDPSPEPDVSETLDTPGRGDSGLALPDAAAPPRVDAPAVADPHAAAVVEAVVELEPSDPGSDEVPLAGPAPEDAQARRPAASRLPEEQIPVVRPEVRDEVPMAKFVTERAAGGPAGTASAGTPVALQPLAPREAHGELDPDPQEATQLFDSAMLSELDPPEPLGLTPAPVAPRPVAPVSPGGPLRATDPAHAPTRSPLALDLPALPVVAGDEDEEQVTMMFDTGAMGADLDAAMAHYTIAPEDGPRPTAVPGTDASEHGDASSAGDPSTSDWLGPRSAQAPAFAEGPAVGDLTDAVDLEPLPEPPRSFATLAATALVVLMLVLMAIYVGVRLL